MLNKMMDMASVAGILVFAVATVAVLVMISKLFIPDPGGCLEAPKVVGGWHTVIGHPRDRYICGWHSAGIPAPVYRCVRMEACR